MDDLSPASRREFLKRATGAALLAAAAPYARAFAARGAIGIQLYSVRGLMAKDAGGTLAALSAIGYREVELAGFYGMTAAQMKALLARHALAAPSSHSSLTDLRAHWPQALADAQTLGQHYLVCAWIDEPDRTPDGYRKIAGEFNAFGKAARERGIQFGFHNYTYDFKPFANGTLPYDLLLAECDPQLVKFEIDLFWMAKGGADPVAYFARWPGRFPLIHVKDMNAAGVMVDAGQGTIDIKAIVAHARQGGVEHWFVEHDEPPDPLGDARVSFDYLRPLIP
jgi:sugar phosphate isomerase/epimerase